MSGEDLSDAGLELGGNAAAVTAVVGGSPGDDGAVVFQRREGLVSGEDLADAGLELAGNAAAVAAVVARQTDNVPADDAAWCDAPPGDDGAVVFQRREGRTIGEDLADTGLELGGNAAAVTAVADAPPCDDGAVVFERREGTGVPEFPAGATRGGGGDRCALQGRLSRCCAAIAGDGGDGMGAISESRNLWHREAPVAARISGGAPQGAAICEKFNADARLCGAGEGGCGVAGEIVAV